MWDRKEVKARGKKYFKGNYWKSVLCAALLSVLTCGSSITSRLGGDDDSMDNDGTTDAMNDLSNDLDSVDSGTAGTIIAAIIGIALVILIITFLLKIFVFNPLQVGCYGFFKENAGGYNPDLGILKTGFTHYGHTFATLFLRDIFLLLWTLLLIFPGVIKAYSYRMVPFILRDNPEMSAKEVITASRKLMDGHKWNVFVFDLSYIGWFLLSIITLGLLNVFWTEPYRQNANAVIYRSLIGDTDEYKPEEEVVVPRTVELPPLSE